MNLYEKSIDWFKLSIKIQYNAAKAMEQHNPGIKFKELYDRCKYYRLAIKALKEMAEREKGCCHCNKISQCFSEDNPCDADCDLCDIKSNDKYCRNCGRKLGE